MERFEAQIENLDLKLFEQIHSQTSDNDKRSLLACQKAVRGLIGEYVYLEIGSYVGGSLQPYILDENCKKIISIDKRPQVAPDERGMAMVYQNNTTQLMLENLKKLSSAGTDKIETIDGDVGEIGAGLVTERPQLCFIDGEHTDEATFRDFEFCRREMTADGAILFHDAPIIYNALTRIVNLLKEEKVNFRAYNLPDTVFVLELGEFPLCRSAAISEMLFDNHVGYLHSLNFTDQYRRFANRKIFRLARDIKLKFTGANVTK